MDKDYKPLEEDYNLSIHNPYVYNSNIVQYQTATTSFKTIKLQDSIYLHIPDDLLYKAICIEQKLFTIKLICLFDYIVNLCYFINGYRYGLIISGISLTGYLSTIYHKKLLFLFYLTYQYVLCLSKCSLMIFFIIVTNNEKLQKQIEDINHPAIPYAIDTNTNYIFLAFVSFIFFLIQVGITRYCTQYYILLPTSKTRARVFLTFDELV